jgi:hypothetical protein
LKLYVPSQEYRFGFGCVGGVGTAVTLTRDVYPASCRVPSEDVPTPGVPIEKSTVQRRERHLSQMLAIARNAGWPF